MQHSFQRDGLVGVAPLFQRLDYTFDLLAVHMLVAENAPKVQLDFFLFTQLFGGRVFRGAVFRLGGLRIVPLFYLFYCEVRFSVFFCVVPDLRIDRGVFEQLFRRALDKPRLILGLALVDYFIDGTDIVGHLFLDEELPVGLPEALRGIHGRVPDSHALLDQVLVVLLSDFHDGQLLAVFNFQVEVLVVVFTARHILHLLRVAIDRVF